MPSGHPLKCLPSTCLTSSTVGWAVLNENNEKQVSQSQISTLSVERFMWYMQKFIYGIMQTRLSCGLIRPKIRTAWRLVKVSHIEFEQVCAMVHGTHKKLYLWPYAKRLYYESIWQSQNCPITFGGSLPYWISTIYVQQCMEYMSIYGLM
jgi:hypothetical protein